MKEERRGQGMGPLSGLKVIEVASIGPAPFCCMMLSDMGAEVVRVERMEPADLGTPADPKFNFLYRGRRSIKVDLKQHAGVETVLRLVSKADILVEGFRPGVMERLGLAPEVCFKSNPRLIYGRMTGWGQTGPLAQRAAHDINYLALTGALGTMGPREGPPLAPPLLIGDFGGGGMYLAFGILCAVIERMASGKGQVVDAAMVDGITSLMTMIYATMARGAWSSERGTNMLDGGAPFYRAYETKDGKYITIGPIEARFYRDLVKRIGLEGEDTQSQYDRAAWPALTDRFAAIFKSRTRDEWTALLQDTDVCYAPVLDPLEACGHPHLQGRKTVVDYAGMLQPAPAPRFSRSNPEIRSPPSRPGIHTGAVLSDWGFNTEEVERLASLSAIGGDLS